MIRTVTYDDSTHKIVPIEADEIQIQQGCLSQTIGKFANYEEWWNSHSSGVSERIRDLIAKDYRAMIAAAPEYQDVSLLIQFAWFIPACGMFARSKEECDKWIAAGHKVIPLHVIPESYQEPTKDE